MKSDNAVSRPIETEERELSNSEASLTASLGPTTPGPDGQDEEDNIPALVTQAVAEAARRARSSGVTMVERSGDQLVKIAPDGTRTVLKQLAPRARVAIGKHTLRR